MVGTKTHHEAQQNEQDHIFGPAVAARPVSHRVFLGRLGELAADLVVATQDESQWKAKPNDASKQEN